MVIMSCLYTTDAADLEEEEEEEEETLFVNGMVTVGTV